MLYAQPWSTSAWTHLAFLMNAGGTPAVPLRLTGDNKCNSGRVEVLRDGVWGQVGGAGASALPPSLPPTVLVLVTFLPLATFHRPMFG